MLALGALLAGLSAYLLAPLHAPRALGAEQPLHVVLCDLSPSVLRTRPGWSAWFAEQLAREAASARAAGAELYVAAFGRDVQRIVVPDRPLELEAWLERLDALEIDGLARDSDRAASDLWGAASLAQEFAGARELTQLTLIGEGSSTGRDPQPVLDRLRARAARRALRAPPPAELDDLAVTALQLAPQVESGAPLVARVWLRWVRGTRSAGATRARVEIELRAPAGELNWSQDVPLGDERERSWPVDFALGPAQSGTTRVDVRAGVLPGGVDAVPENDALWATARAGNALRVAVYSSTAGREAASSWSRALAVSGGLDVRSCAPEEFAASLASDDVLVHFDVDLAAISAPALEGYLAGGGGWLCCGGEANLQAGSRKAASARLCPLDFQPDDLPPRDVVLLLDASGSMAAPGAAGAGSALDQARYAALRLAQAAPSNERVVLRWFGARLEAEVPVDPQRSPQELAQELARRNPGGATDIPGALESLAAQQTSAQRAALALLVTDGRDQRRDADALFLLRERLRAAQIELAVFAVGAAADLQFLAALVGPAGRLQRIEEQDDLAQLLEREARAGEVRDRGPYRSAFAEPLGPLADAAAGARSVGPQGPPEFERYLRSKAQPEAEVAWVASSGEGAGEPLLAVARSGLGAAAALAGLPTAAAAPRQAELVRWLGRGRPPRRPRAQMVQGRLEIEHVPPDWPLSLLARAAADPAGPSVTLLPPEETLVDSRDRRVGAWPHSLPDDGAFALFAADAATGGSAQAVLVASSPAAPEFAWPIQAVELDADGSSSPDPEGLPEPPEAVSHPLGVPLLGAALLLIAAAGLSLGRGTAGSQGARADGR